MKLITHKAIKTNKIVHISYLLCMSLHVSNAVNFVLLFEEEKTIGYFNFKKDIKISIIKLKSRVDP